MLVRGVILRLVQAFSLEEGDVAAICAAGGIVVDEARATKLAVDSDLAATPEELTAFLDGLIERERGMPQGAPPPKIAATTNNIVLRKLRIATQCRDADMLALIEAGGLRISKHELSALFRKPNHAHYRECGDQIVRKFLIGLVRKRRPELDTSPRARDF